MKTVLNNFEILAYTPCGFSNNRQVTALSKSGATGIFDLAYCDVSHRDSIINTIKHAKEFLVKEAPIGIRVSKETELLVPELLTILKEFNITVIYSQWHKATIKKVAQIIHKHPTQRLLLEVVDLQILEDTLHMIEDLTTHQKGIILCGQEASGYVGDTASFLMLQKALQFPNLSIYLKGGIGTHTASACYALGLAGIVLDDQLLLLKESPLDASSKRILEKIEARDTLVYGMSFATTCRGISHPLFPKSKALLKEADALEAVSTSKSSKEWDMLLTKSIGWGNTETSIWPIGQTIELAKKYADLYKTTGRFIQGFKKEIIRISTLIAAHKTTLSANAPLAQTHQTIYPIVQGPMTRVSDTPEFAEAIATGGGLPFIAVALKKKDDLNELLKNTKATLKEASWGVGLLGFIDPSLYKDQLRCVLAHKPPFALLAGGQPNQVKELEDHHISTYVHVPSGGLLKNFIHQGIRKFVFEGRECGGHVGPMHSFPLWESAIEILTNEIPEAEKSKVQILFAGGIHDQYSAAIITALTAELQAQGMQSGILMGTAYLATKEAVTTKAITPSFQELVVKQNSSVLLNSAVGHSNRCVKSDFTDEFNAKRKELLQKNTDPDTIREQLDGLLLGRLRIASKGIQRDEKGTFIKVSKKEQKESGMFMSGDIAKFISGVQTIQELHEQIANATTLLKDIKIPEKVVPKKATPADVAIVGMSVHVPGSRELNDFFEQIIKKKSNIIEIPLDRWDWRLYYSPDKNDPDKIYSKWGGFVDEILFDPLEYGIPPKSIPHIGVAQLLSLEAVKSSLTDAGYTPDQLDKDNVSVIFAGSDAAGFFGNELVIRSTSHLFSATEREATNKRLPVWTEETFPGTITNVVAGRVANRFDFGGSNYTVDAACASSIVALNNGVRELTSGRSNVAIVGGVDMGQTPHGYMSFSKTQALSEKGQSIPFDKDADGIVISEGLAVVVLKRLEDAERDGDTIYSVIKGVAGSSDGRAMGMTAPRPIGQKRALERSYEEAGFSTSSIDYYEAHGTGTAVGDQAELTSISEVLKSLNTPAKSISIGSVKNLIGHTKITAGLVSTVKTALALHHKILPPQGGVSTPRDIINTVDSPLSIQQKATYWPKPKYHPRRAGVSAFGFGGTNYHAVLEEYVTPKITYGSKKHPAELFVFKAKDKEQLKQQLTDWVAVLENHTDIALRNLAYTAYVNSTSKDDACKLTLICRDSIHLKDSIHSTLKHIENPEQYLLPTSGMVSFEKKEVVGKTAILFPGQGAQYLNMGQELGLYFAPFGNNADLMHQTIGDNYDTLPFKIINPPASFDLETTKNQEVAINNTHLAQPAIGWSCKSYFDVLTEFGLHYDCLAGHSYGEYTALHAAGVLSQEDFFILSEVRGRLMAESDNGIGGMAAILDTRKNVETYLTENLCDAIVLANHNHTQQVVISGPKTDVEKVATHFKDSGKSVFMLPVSGAFHSSLMEEAQAPLAKAIKNITFSSPKKPVYNNTTAKPYSTDSSKIQDQLQNHLLKPVEFVTQIEDMYEDGVQNFIELGPKSILTKCVKDILKNQPHQAYAVEEHGRDFNSFLQFIVTLWIEGYITDTAGLYDSRDCEFIAINRLKNTPKKNPKPTSWIINGTRSTPISASFLEKREAPLLTLENIENEKNKQQIPIVENTVVSATTPLMTPKKLPVHTNTPQTTDAMMDAYEAYQNTMTQFLKTQETVMQSFLQASNTPGVQMPTPQPIASPKEAVTPSPSVAPSGDHQVVAEKKEVIKVPIQKTKNVEKRLIEIISDKTGYPEDMLSVDLDIEAELGIDSIKRVEIFDEMLKTLSETAVQNIKQHSQDIIQTKYLKGWIDLFKKYNDEENLTTPLDTHKVAVASPPTLSKESIQQKLISIISDHTGYPIDMIDPNLDIEAELSIDSIKRIEIFDTYLKTLEQPYQENIQKSAEKIVRHKKISDWTSMIIETLDILPISTPIPDTNIAKKTMQIAPEALQKKLISIISEHTGYPDEMIDPTLDIEAELSIDSIKRIEIFDTFLKTLDDTQQEKIKKEAEKIVRHKRIIDWMQMIVAVLETPSQTEIPIALEVSKEVEVRFTRNAILNAIPEPTDSPRYIMKAIEQELPNFRRKLITGLYLIVPDQLHIADRVSSRLEEVGACSDVIPLEKCKDYDTLEAHISELRMLFGPVQGIIHLGALTTPENINPSNWKSEVDSISKTLFNLIKICDADFKNTKISGAKTIIAVTNFGGFYGRDLTLKHTSPIGGSHQGMLKSLEYEWEQMLPKTIDLETTIHPDQAALAIFKEIQSPSSHFEVGYKNGKRFIFKAEHTPLQAVQPSQTQCLLLPESDWVILITGGSRGITAEVTKKYAVPGARFILVGNGSWEDFSSKDDTTMMDVSQLRTHLITKYKNSGSKITPAQIEKEIKHILRDREITKNISYLRSKGVMVTYEQSDVSNTETFGKLIDTIYQKYDRIDMVIHGAGMIDDKFISDKTEDSFDKVFNTKVNSSMTLYEKLRLDSLKCIVFFSSTAGRFGNKGQTDYAAANEILNRLAWKIKSDYPDMIVKSFNWGPWAQIGMASSVVNEQFIKRGIIPIEPDQGAAYFVQELNNTNLYDVEVIFGQGTWDDRITHPIEALFNEEFSTITLN